jgi:hypothetical protein
MRIFLMNEKISVRRDVKIYHQYFSLRKEKGGGAKRRRLTVPPPTVQSRRVLPQLVNDLVHLERGSDRLDEDGRTNRAARDAEVVLRETEDVVPETRFQVVFHLREAVGGGKWK